MTPLTLSAKSALPSLDRTVTLETPLTSHVSSAKTALNSLLAVESPTRRSSPSPIKIVGSKLNETQVTLLHQLIASEELAKYALLFEFLGVKIDTCIRISLSPNSDAYKTFIPLFIKTSLCLNSIIPTQNNKPLFASISSTKKQQMIQDLRENWENWRKITEESFQARLTAIKGNHKLEKLYDTIENFRKEFSQCIELFKELLEDSKTRYCFLSEVGSLCPSSDTKISSQDFLKKYITFVLTCFENYLETEFKNSQKKDRNLLQIQQTRELLTKLNTHEEYLQLLDRFRRTILEHNDILDAADRYFESLSDTQSRFNAEIKRAAIRSCLHFFDTLANMSLAHMKTTFPDLYAFDQDTLTLLDRLTTNLHHISKIIKFNDQAQLIGLIEFNVQETNSKKISPIENLSSEKLTAMIYSYFNPCIQELADRWWNYWPIKVETGSLAFFELAERPVSFTQEGIRGSVEQFRALIPSLPQLKEEIFTFLVFELLPTLPPKKQTADYLRKLVQHTFLSYSFYAFVVADGARLLKEPFSEDNLIHPYVTEILFLQGIEEIMPRPASKTPPPSIIEESTEESTQSEPILDIPAIEEAPSLEPVAPIPDASHLNSDATQPEIQPVLQKIIPSREDKYVRENLADQSQSQMSPISTEFGHHKQGAISSREMEKFFKNNGFFRVHQRGSHIKFQHPSGYCEILPANKPALGIGLSNEIQKRVHKIITESQFKK